MANEIEESAWFDVVKGLWTTRQILEDGESLRYAVTHRVEGVEVRATSTARKEKLYLYHW